MCVYNVHAVLYCAVDIPMNNTVQHHYSSTNLATHHFCFKDCRADVCRTLSYLCYLGQTIGDMIWRKTVPTPQRSLLWPVSLSCSEYYTALALQPLCNCKGVKKNKHFSLNVWKHDKLSTWQEGKFDKFNGNVWIHSCLIFFYLSLHVTSSLSSSVEILAQRRTENMTPRSGKTPKMLPVIFDQIFFDGGLAPWKHLCAVGCSLHEENELYGWLCLSPSVVQERPYRLTLLHWLTLLVSLL